jgi:hypothetical protein
VSRPLRARFIQPPLGEIGHQDLAQAKPVEHAAAVRCGALRSAADPLPQPPEYPPITAGVILAGRAGAGRYFPQPIAASRRRLDDPPGRAASIIARSDLAYPAFRAL